MVKLELNKLSTSLKTFLDEGFLNESSRISYDVSAKELTTAALGGRIPIFLELNKPEDFRRIIGFFEKYSLVPKFLGNGSNVVISDNGLDVPVLKISSKIHFEKINESNNENFFSVSSGVSLIGLSRELSNLGFIGLEFAAGIPGTLGGAVKMNAGAHGEDISSIIEEVTVYSFKDGLKKYKNSDLNFSYRHSNILDDEFILNVTLKMKRGDADVIKSKRLSALNYRKQTQPLHLPSSGSVFRNPSKEVSAGFLIESSGLKSQTLGGVAVSDMHANWIVKVSDIAKASDFFNLVDLIKNNVYKTHKIELNQEVIFW